MTHRLRAPIVVATALTLLGALAPLRASGTTIDDKKQEAAQLAQEIQSNGDRIDALGEAYNGAVLEYQNAQSGVANAKRRYAAAEAQQQQLSSLVAARGAELYQGAQDPTSLLPNTNIQSVNELGVRTQYGAVATGNDEQLISNLVRAKQDLQVERARLDKQVKAAKQKRDFIVSAQKQVEQANSQEKELLSQVKGQIATLIAQAEAAAISYAEAQLGKPYQYAAVGPGTYDCSGLTMMAWAAAGVSMPHYSGAQYQMFPHVPFGQLEPGDLLFWGPGGSEHVAMYIGGGLQIAATHTGDYVRIQPIGRNPIGAARP